MLGYFSVSGSFRVRLSLIVLCCIFLLALVDLHRKDAKLTLSLSRLAIDKLNLYRQPHDTWQPPFDWTGESVVYDNFKSINHRYTSGTRNLEKPLWAWSRKPTLVPDFIAFDQEDIAFPRVSCRGPRGRRMNDSEADLVRRNFEVSQGFAEPAIGSSSLVGFEKNICYDRLGRHGPYSTRPDKSLGKGEANIFKWEDVHWAQLQRECYKDNEHRFDSAPRHTFNTPPRLVNESFDSKSRSAPRTAVVIRSHQDQIYTEEVKRVLRSLIEELALYTGSEYAVFLFVHVKDTSRKIWEDPTAYQQTMVDFVPPEFHSITVLWNDADWHKDYPLIPSDFLNVHMSQWLPMQRFQRLYPEFDYYWNWEMDTRYIGHYYDFVRAVDSFSASQPRKGLWERNARFYIPSLHKSYNSFRDRIQARYITADGSDTSIWGPHFPGGRVSSKQSSLLAKLNTTPPTLTPAGDDFEWGVGESADFVTFLPMFNPDPTPYVFHDAFRNYDTDISSDKIYRRTTIITLSRLSSRLLHLMEAENREPPTHHMSSESWPHSVSLHYGLKAVSIPHGIYMEQEWPPRVLDFVFNNGDQEWILKYHPAHEKLDHRGEGSGGPESTFGWGREHNWIRSTWYYQNRFAAKLYKRWLGWEYDGIGGPEWEKKHGTYCLPPMLLHPIKVLEDPPHDTSRTYVV